MKRLWRHLSGFQRIGSAGTGRPAVEPPVTPHPASSHPVAHHLAARRRVLAAAGWLSGVALLAAGAPARAAEAAWPTHVSTVYRLYFNGFDVGSFAFNSQSTGKTYALTSKADVSALFGAFKWNGTLSASGSLAQGNPQPVAYLLNFRTKKKQGLVRLGFDKGAVKAVTVEPKKDWVSPEAVPLKPEHKQSVFDPMSAILALTAAGGKEPCAKTVPIFDGKARFNLVLSYKGKQKLEEKKSSGQPSELVVCKVKYQPIAGHKPKDFVNPWIKYDSIEIALRPIPSANVYVPYTITVPTSLGSAVMSAEKVDISSEGKPAIALSR